MDISKTTFRNVLLIWNIVKNYRKQMETKYVYQIN